MNKVAEDSEPWEVASVTRSNLVKPARVKTAQEATVLLASVTAHVLSAWQSGTWIVGAAPRSRADCAERRHG